MKFNPAENYPNLISKLRYSPSKEAVKSLERIKRRKKGSRELRGMIEFI